ncbi:DNA helicase II [Teredinibacter sp. KSP-S5-2]|uniref:DNA helicase II n=1 Tax=Teredinibacter sp. KSP-S5-2 TaxID=3034506 RepID=UPI002934D350|nr:DNA helicase II [Teredinibacter sp. KSP-S5-2]WNO09103.1 DNA helicase II [Teredinibacter sp. KSP-S5-2]
MDVNELINDLNDAQRQAVCAPPTNQLVLAGAGSGKTRVLVHRIAWLVQVEGVSPHEILAVTFTNKAAREMRERLSSLLQAAPGGSMLRGMWVGTFHGLAHRLLKSHWHEAGLPENFQILDSDDQLRVVKRVYQALNLDDSRWPFKQSQWFINGQKDEGVRAQHITEGHDPYLTTMKMVYAAYEEACERGGMVDFAELLLRSHELWLKDANLLKHYQNRFKYILVDEFQDTNAVQYAWLRVLAGQTSKVIAVGDDDQSIYGWRGARIENIQKFEKDFEQVEITRLEQNYRSTGTILKAANAVIENNADRMGKSLWTSDADGEPIDLYAAFNEQDEARYIVDRVRTWVNQGNNYSDAAILYRSNAQSRVLEEAFLRDGMPYRIYGGQRFYERMEIRNALAYLRLLGNRHDDAAFERVFNTPTRGIGSKTQDDIRMMAREQGCSMFQATVGAVNHGVFTARATNALKGFLVLLDELQEATTGMALADIAEHVIRNSGLLDFHQKEKGERGQARVENLQELVNACRAFEAEESDLTPLQEFLDSAALDAGDAQADDFEDAVQMMTLHSAKGLEFPLVFLAGMEEGLFPHKMSAEEPGRLEEERRLAYVGITRGMEKLVMTYAECRRLHGTDTFNALSRFVREIPDQYIQEVRIKSAISRPVSYAQKVNTAEITQDYPGLGLGQQVFHQVFGEGTILQFEGQGNGARVQVKFNTEGIKWLVLQYAKLEPLS